MSGGVPAGGRRLTNKAHHEVMLDAQSQCLPCKLCGGKAVISDAGTGAGYYIKCENSTTFRPFKGCLIDHRRVSGWAYNVMEWWNRLMATSTPPIEGRDADVEREELNLLRSREMQAMGAAISNNCWHAMEVAYNAGRDRLDRVLNNWTTQPSDEPCCCILSERDGEPIGGACPACVAALARTRDPAPVGWQNIDTAPRDGTRFDVWVPSYAESGKGYRVSDVKMTPEGRLFHYDPSVPIKLAHPPSHWRPLPDGPSAVAYDREQRA